MSRYTIRSTVTLVPHPDVPPEGFGSAMAAVLWAEEKNLSAYEWWPVDVDPQPARLEGV